MKNFLFSLSLLPCPYNSREKARIAKGKTEAEEHYSPAAEGTIIVWLGL